MSILFQLNLISLQPGVALRVIVGAEETIGSEANSNVAQAVTERIFFKLLFIDLLMNSY